MYAEGVPLGSAKIAKGDPFYVTTETSRNEGQSEYQYIHIGKNYMGGSYHTIDITSDKKISGWYRDENCSQNLSSPSNYSQADTDITFYAKWLDE